MRKKTTTIKTTKKTINLADEKPVRPSLDTSTAVVRGLAAAFRQVEEFDAFAKGLESALGKAEFFDKATLNLASKSGVNGTNGSGKEISFPAATLCLPLAGRDRVHGMAGFSSEQHKFGPGDLHLMAGLADLVSILMDHALQFGEQRRNLALLNFLLSQVPAGVVCFDHRGQILVSNAVGQRMVAPAGMDGQKSAMPEDWVSAARAGAAAGEFHRKADGQLLHVSVKTTASTAGGEVTALVLVDLSAEREKFHEALARESYRCGWLARPLTLALVSAGNYGELMSVLGPLRERLGPEVIVGPCDCDSIGIVFPESSFAQAMEKVRNLRLLLEDDWEVGVSESHDKQGNPEGLFAAASAAKRRVGDFLRRRLLLHDDHASVNDMLELVLRDDFSLVKSSDLDFTMRHLRTGVYDGFFSEIDLGHGGSALELVRVAREANPRIKPFFTSAAADLRRAAPEFAKEIIFRKPFDVKEVVGAVRSVFA